LVAALVVVCAGELVPAESRDDLMRVLHVIPSVAERSGGPATAILPMCRAVQALGIEVVLATTSHGLTQMHADQTAKGLAVRIFPAQFGESFKYSRPLAAWLDTSVEGFDLVHIHAVFNHASIAAARACWMAGVPYVVRPLGTLDPWSMKQKPVRKRVFWFVSGRKMLQHSAAVHYTAQGEKEATEKHLRMNHGRVIPLGVDVNGGAQTHSVAGSFPALAQHPYVLVLSRLDPKKGVDVLIEAFVSLVRRPQFANWRLVIAGDGPRDYVAGLKEKAANSHRIMFTGWVEGEQKEALLQNASLLALPSRHENFGLCVLEAMARGVPVLVSPHVNLAREIEAADAGWIVAREQLTSGLAAALSDESGRIRRGRAARVFAQRYSWKKTATDLIELYEECLSKSRH
jgi:glycosyltransferase involved in cell wall biosynthesis